MLKALFISVRPKQWVKNLIIFAPLIFSRSLTDWDRTLWVSIAFGLFCLLTGSVYLLNDLMDIEKDRLHPRKRLRPLPSGQLAAPVAIVALLLLSGGSLTASFLISPAFGTVATLYFLINLLYSLWLKHIVIVDVMLIALGFVLRVVAGAVVIAVGASSWLLMCTIMLALFLGIAKRKNELVLLNEAAEGHRKVLEHYNHAFLDQMITIVTTGTIMSYALYAIAPGHDADSVNSLIYTVPFVLYGIFRYLYLVNVREEGGSPTQVLLTDKPTLINVVLWLAACLLIIEGVL
jgi:4-hydroxybenzoate polyprenyltransferase